MTSSKRNSLIIKLLDKLKKTSAQKMTATPPNLTRDSVNLDLWGVRIIVSRETASPVPSEMSVYVPRAEYRHSCEQNSSGLCKTELVLSSITIVFSPRHPEENRRPPEAARIK